MDSPLATTGMINKVLAKAVDEMASVATSIAHAHVQVQQQYEIQEHLTTYPSRRPFNCLEWQGGYSDVAIDPFTRLRFRQGKKQTRHTPWMVRLPVCSEGELLTWRRGTGCVDQKSDNRDRGTSEPGTALDLIHRVELMKHTSN